MWPTRQGKRKRSISAEKIYSSYKTSKLGVRVLHENNGDAVA